MTRVVVMAGGRGMRLHPLTEKTPKPLIKVGSKPMLQTIIEGFAAQGFKRFTLCVNYKAELIIDYFGNGEPFGVHIDYAHETEPLGTAGALKLIPGLTEPFIVTNADVLTQIDYVDLMAFHARHGANATMCAALYQHQVPFGVIEHEGACVTGIREKPIENFPVGAGIYVLNPSVLDEIDGHCDMPDLLQRALGVAMYEITGFWLDVGRFEDLSRAQAMMA